MFNEMSESARALAQHNPPRAIWRDDGGRVRFKCRPRHESERHAACPGCQETAEPPRSAVVFRGAPQPPVSAQDRKAQYAAEQELGQQP